jgi:hypothetical protein
VTPYLNAAGGTRAQRKAFVTVAGDTMHRAGCGDGKALREWVRG